MEGATQGAGWLEGVPMEGATQGAGWLEGVPMDCLYFAHKRPATPVHPHSAVIRRLDRPPSLRSIVRISSIFVNFRQFSSIFVNFRENLRNFREKTPKTLGFKT